MAAIHKSLNLASGLLEAVVVAVGEGKGEGSKGTQNSAASLHKLFPHRTRCVFDIFRLRSIACGPCVTQNQTNLWSWAVLGQGRRTSTPVSTFGGNLLFCRFCSSPAGELQFFSILCQRRIPPSTLLCTTQLRVYAQNVICNVNSNPM